MKSDEMVTGSVPEGMELTPDAEGEEMGNEGVNEPDAASPPKKPNLSKEQQEWLNRVFIPNFRKELLRQVQFDRKALEQHKRELDRRKKDEETHKESLRAAQEENEKLVRTISELRIDKALVSAAAANNAVNPQQVQKLLKDQVTLGEDLEPIVLDEKGERQLSQNGEYMTVEERVKSFLAENPHLVKSSPSKGGSGSAGFLGTGRGFSGGMTTSGDLIIEGLAEESRKTPTQTLADYDEEF